MFKRRSIVILSGILVLALCIANLAGCSNTRCETPSNLTVSNSLVVSWDAVEGADRYMLAFNGNASTQFMTQNTSYNIKTAGAEVTSMLKSGEQNSVTVRAVKVETQGDKLIPYNLSEWAQAVTFVYSRQASTVSNLTYDGETHSLKWRKVTENNAEYVLGVREKGATEITEISLADYEIKPNSITGNITLDISAILATLENKVYELAVKVKVTGYDDGDWSNFAEADLTGGLPVDPDPDPDPDPEPDPSQGKLVSITAFYTGPQLQVGTTDINAYLIVTALYDNDAEKKVYDFTTDIVEHNGSAGDKTVTVTYTEDDVTVTATVTISFADDVTDPADPDGQPQQKNYKLMGVNGDFSDGMTYTSLSGTRMLWKAVILDGTHAVNITYGEEVYGYAKLSNAEEVAAKQDSEGNILLPQGEYDIYLDYSFEGKNIYIESIVYTTIYYYNADGWENVYAYAWRESQQAVTPSVGDFVIMGDIGLGEAWTTESSVKLSFDGSNQYVFKGLRLSAGSKFKIVQLGETQHNYYNGVESWVGESLYTVDEEGNIVIAQDGIYDFYFKADTQLLYFETGTTESTPNVEITSTEVTNAWPGNKMQAVEGKDGWYSITIRGKAEKIIFNEGTGDDNDKTADLTIDFDNIYYKDGKWQSDFE